MTAAGGDLSPAKVGVDGACVEVDGVALFDVVRDLAVADVEFTREQVEELEANMLMRLGFSPGLGGEELGEVGVELAVWHEVAEAFEEVAGVFDAALGQANALLGAVDAEELLGLRLEEIAEVFGEDHGNACEVAQGRDDAACLQLGEEAGGEAGMASEFHEAHGLSSGGGI